MKVCLAPGWRPGLVEMFAAVVAFETVAQDLSTAFEYSGSSGRGFQSPPLSKGVSIQGAE